jgi:hypothetical protein
LLKWLLTTLLAVLVLGAFTPWVQRLRLRRMPGDIEVQRGSRRYVFAFGSTLLLTLVAALIFWMLR